MRKFQPKLRSYFFTNMNKPLRQNYLGSSYHRAKHMGLIHLSGPQVYGLTLALIKSRRFKQNLAAKLENLASVTAAAAAAAAASENFRPTWKSQILMSNRFLRHQNVDKEKNYSFNFRRRKKPKAEILENLGYVITVF